MVVSVVGADPRREQRRLTSPTGAAPERLRIATWNLNSLKVRLGAVERFLHRARPDVVCLQETKAAALSDPAAEVFERLGYGVAYAGDGPYNGVVVASRHPITAVQPPGEFGDEHLDREARVISCLVDTPRPLRVVSVYVPHGRSVGHWHYDYKLAFLDGLTAQVARWVEEEPLVVVAGDLNVAPTDSDVFHPDAFVGVTHVTPPEREALARLLDAGLVDVDAQRWGPAARRFTWWNHGYAYPRDLGMRIDLIAADRRLASRLDTTWIDHGERALDRPSDHAALLADFHLDDAAAGPQRS